MKETIYKILGHLCQFVEKDKDLFYDGDEIWQNLCDLGFQEDEIEETLLYIEGLLLKMPGPFWSDTIPVNRVFSREERLKLAPRVQGFLWRLKLQGTIDHALEDEIIERILALEEGANLKDIKTVAALTIFGYELKFQRDLKHEIKGWASLH